MGRVNLTQARARICFQRFWDMCRQRSRRPGAVGAAVSTRLARGPGPADTPLKRSSVW